MWIQRVLDNSWLSCHKYAQRASQTYDRDLPFRERCGLIFHYYFCPVCRRFASNLSSLQQSLKKLGQRIQAGEMDQRAPLPTEAREKILAQLRQLS